MLEKRVMTEVFFERRENIINAYVFDYDPEDEMEIRAFARDFENRASSLENGLKIASFDLFQVCVEILKSKGYLEKVLEKEAELGSASILAPSRRALRLTLDNDLVASEIAAKVVPGRDLVLLKGVGAAWPIIRSHSLLNSLHVRMGANPILLFYPGVYGEEPKLFGEMDDGHYYRAFRIVER
jgi:hypothetical protein